MAVITLYYGSPDKILTPAYGSGDDKHDSLDSDANTVTRVFSTLFER